MCVATEKREWHEVKRRPSIWCHTRFVDLLKLFEIAQVAFAEGLVDPLDIDQNATKLLYSAYVQLNPVPAGTRAIHYDLVSRIQDELGDWLKVRSNKKLIQPPEDCTTNLLIAR